MPNFRPLVRCVAMAVVGVMWLGAVAGPAAAEDWMFYRSYFSHIGPMAACPGYPQPYSRSAYRPAVAGTTPGFAVRGGFRSSTIVLGVGPSFDVTVLREGWMERRP